MFQAVSGALSGAKRWISLTLQQMSGKPIMNELIISQVMDRLRFNQYVDPKEGETPQMRNSYRSLVTEPTVKSCFDTLMVGVSGSELDVPPVDKNNPRDREVADFCKDLTKECKGGPLAILQATIGNGLVEGYSLAEPKWEVRDRGRWEGKIMLDEVKPKPTDDYWFEVDKFWNITGVRSRLEQKLYPVENFIYWRNQQGYTPSPHGTSLLKACYRSAWMLDTVWKLRGIGLERYTLPVIIGKYPDTDNKVKASMSEAVKRLKANGYGLIPQGASIEALQMAQRGGTDFADSIKDLKEDVCISMMGGSLQTLQGYTPGGRGSSQVHQGVVDGRIWMYGAAFCELLHRQLYTRAVRANYGADCPVPWPVLGGLNDDEVRKSIELDQLLQSMNFPVSLKDIAERARRSPGVGDDILKPPSQQQPAGGLGGLMGGGGNGNDPFDGSGSEMPPEGQPDVPAGQQPGLFSDQRPPQVVIINPRPEYQSFSASDWTPGTGPKGGHYWQNTKTGEKVYQQDNPGGSGDGQAKTDEPATSGKDTTPEGKPGKAKPAKEIPPELAAPQPILPGSKPWGLKPYNVSGYTTKVKTLLDTVKAGVTPEGITKEAYDQAYETLKGLSKSELYAAMALLGVKGDVKNPRVAAWVKTKALAGLNVQQQEQAQAMLALTTAPEQMTPQQVAVAAKTLQTPDQAQALGLADNKPETLQAHVVASKIASEKAANPNAQQMAIPPEANVPQKTLAKLVNMTVSNPDIIDPATAYRLSATAKDVFNTGTPTQTELMLSGLGIQGKYGAITQGLMGSNALKSHILGKAAEHNYIKTADEFKKNVTAGKYNGVMKRIEEEASPLAASSHLTPEQKVAYGKSIGLNLLIPDVNSTAAYHMAKEAMMLRESLMKGIAVKNPYILPTTGISSLENSQKSMADIVGKFEGTTEPKQLRELYSAMVAKIHKAANEGDWSDVVGAGLIGANHSPEIRLHSAYQALNKLVANHQSEHGLGVDAYSEGDGMTKVGMSLTLAGPKDLQENPHAFIHAMSTLNTIPGGAAVASKAATDAGLQPYPGISSGVGPYSWYMSQNQAKTERPAAPSEDEPHSGYSWGYAYKGATGQNGNADAVVSHAKEIMKAKLDWAIQQDPGTQLNVVAALATAGHDFAGSAQTPKEALEAVKAKLEGEKTPAPAKPVEEKKPYQAGEKGMGGYLAKKLQSGQADAADAEAMLGTLATQYQDKKEADKITPEEINATAKMLGMPPTYQAGGSDGLMAFLEDAEKHLSGAHPKVKNSQTFESLGMDKVLKMAMTPGDDQKNAASYFMAKIGSQLAGYSPAAAGDVMKAMGKAAGVYWKVYPDKAHASIPAFKEAMLGKISEAGGQPVYQQLLPKAKQGTVKQMLEKSWNAKPVEPPKPMVQQKPVAFHPEFSGYTKDTSKTLGGSTGAYLAKDQAGKQYVIKAGKSPQHIQSEYAANQLYRLMGAATPQGKLYNDTHQVSEHLPGQTLGEIKDENQKKKYYQQLGQHFVMDALLANWDVLGSKGDNVIVHDGNVYRIDNGGSLGFRAMGGEKGASLTDDVGELDSMRDASKNPGAAAAFGHLTDADIQSQISQVVSQKDKLLELMPVNIRAKMAKRIDSLKAWKPKPKASGKHVLGEGGAEDHGNETAVRTKGNVPSRTIDVSPSLGKAISSYTGSGYNAMNSQLWKIPPVSDSELDNRSKTLIKAFDSVLQKPFPKPVVLMRGFRVNDSATIKLRDQLDQALANPGSTMNIRGFVSATSSPETAVSFSGSSQDGNNVMLEIKTRHGLPVTGHSSHSHESETILGHNWEYRVIGKKKVPVGTYGEPSWRTVYQIEHIPPAHAK